MAVSAGLRSRLCQHRARERDYRSTQTIQVGGVQVGDTFTRWINQADRDCQVIAVHGSSYAYDYAMPKGQVFIRVGNRVSGKERPMGVASMPAWVRTACQKDAA